MGFDYLLVSNLWQATEGKEEELNPRFVNNWKVYDKLIKMVNFKLGNEM